MILTYGNFKKGDDTFRIHNVYVVENNEVGNESVYLAKLSNEDKSDYLRYIFSINGDWVSYLLLYHFNFKFGPNFTEGLYNEKQIPDVGRIDYTEDILVVDNINSNKSNKDYLIPNG